MDYGAKIFNRNISIIENHFSQMAGNSNEMKLFQKKKNGQIDWLIDFQCYKYRKMFDQVARNRMREKLTASLIFKNRKSLYALR